METCPAHDEELIEDQDDEEEEVIDLDLTVPTKAKRKLMPIELL